MFSYLGISHYKFLFWSFHMYYNCIPDFGKNKKPGFLLPDLLVIIYNYDIIICYEEHGDWS